MKSVVIMKNGSPRVGLFGNSSPVRVKFRSIPPKTALAALASENLK